MSKIKIRLKLQGLELEIEGERENLPAITAGLKNQFAGILESPSIVVGAQEDGRMTTQQVVDNGDNGEGSRRKKRRSRPSSPGDEASSAAIDFRHDSTKWGVPKQEWTTAQKAMWLLYVVAKQTDKKELTDSSIEATFNKHFRQAKEVRRGNIYRDLGKAKVETPSLVGQDTSKTPSPWYLTSEGEKIAQKLIDAQQGAASPKA